KMELQSMVAATENAVIPCHMAKGENRHDANHPLTTLGVVWVFPLTPLACFFFRRPEITIVAAEPLRPSSWFPGGSRVTPQGLGFPPPPSQAHWRANELVPAELPPSYEQVIKEISQAQVNTTNNNNAAPAPRCTSTSATQTDFPEEIISHLPRTNAKNNLTALLGVLETSVEQNCHEKLNAVICPVPKPRSKGNLRPVVRENQSKAEDNQEEVSKPRSKKDPSLVQLLSLLDDILLDSYAVTDSMNTEKNQNSIVQRIKTFESQVNTETSELSKKPEISPRSSAPKPTITAKKPIVAPKPGATKISGEWDSRTESKRKAASREGHLQPQEAGSSKPELPKKPKPGLVKSRSNDLLDGGCGTASENSDGQKKMPVPAPRPLIPRKSLSLENSTLPSAVTSAPRLSVVSQAKTFRSLEESPANNHSVPTLQSGPVGEEDLISFDDCVVLPPSSTGAVKEIIASEIAADPFQFFSKNEATKEQAVQPAVTRKPTVIRIPAKLEKSLNEVPHIPPPLPAEKPIGNTSATAAGKKSNADESRKGCSRQAGGRSGGWVAVVPPVDGKIIPARPPPPKGAPGRPPLPKHSGSKASSQTDSFCRSSSDNTLHKKHSMFGLGVKRTKSQVLKNQDPALPPRPKPGHPLYNKYMRGDVLVLLDQTDSNYVEYQKGEETGKVHISQMKIITPLDENPKSRQNDSKKIQKIANISAPHAVVLHDFPAEHADDLDLHLGETVYLLEKIDNEWYRGKCGNRTGIFPANFVKVITWRCKGVGQRECYRGPRCIARFEYIGDQKDELSFSEGEVILLKEFINEEWAKGELKVISGIFPLNFVEVIEDLPGLEPPKNEREDSASVSQVESGEWCEALHDFTAETSEDLSFKKGECILILERLDSDWYRGRLNGREGIFPVAFVQTSSGIKGKAKALYDFHSESEDELSFRAGDIITELESVDEDWISGELQGKSGIFPKNFVQVLHTS
uniref:SH3 domain containing 19 n=1 Tax=Sphenodon punctatus TaxID=8508 RepID=A0A8D0LA32_SPHPU